MKIFKERFVRGEIDKQELEERKACLLQKEKDLSHLHKFNKFIVYNLIIQSITEREEEIQL